MTAFTVADPAGIELGEHPLWNASSERAAWIDAFAGELRWPGPCGVDRWGFPPPLGSAALRACGGVVAAAGRGVHFRDAHGHLDRPSLDDLIPDGVRFNDGACDPAGSLLVGTMSVAGEPARGSLYRITPGGDVTVLESAITESNGLAFSPDGSTLYYVDSGEPAVRRYAYRSGGPLRRARDLCAIDPASGTPDGLCVDAGGAVWVALWGGGALWRISPAGELLQVLETPVTQPTCPAFGGEQLRHLFVSTAWEGLGEAERRGQPWAGHLLVCTPEVAGAAPHVFQG